MTETILTDRAISTPLRQDWDLSDLYAGLDDPKIDADLADLQTRASEFRLTYRGNVAMLSADEIAEALQQLEAIGQKTDYIVAYPMLAFAANTRNESAKQAQDRLLEAATDLENLLLFFELELKNLSLERLTTLQANPVLRNYQHYFQRTIEARSHKLSEDVEQTRNKDNLTGRQAFVQLRSVHLGEQDYRPVTRADGSHATTDAELSALLYDADPDRRLAAYTSVRDVLAQHNSLYSYILNSVLQDHRLESQMRSYTSTLHKHLVADEVTEPVFRAIMDGTHQRFDLFQRYYRLKGKTLGQPIRICDLYAPWGSDPTSAITYDTGVATLLDALTQFDVNYARRAEEFFLNHWVDATVRPGKRGGAFCAYHHGKHSYVLMSYTEDYNSLFTLAHELGHGLHFAWIDDRQTFLNSNPPLVSAEVASTFNELLLLDYLLDRAEDNPTLRRALLAQHIEDLLNLIFRQSSISRLELALNERAAIGTITRDFVNTTWNEIYTDLCGDSVELLDAHQYDWARIGHIYFKPFYCYQYTASSLVSLACYQQYQTQGKDFIPGYFDLLAAGGSANQFEVLRQHVGVNLEDTATIVNALEYIERRLDELEATL
jgi:oligoendopeptidase F